MKFIASMKQHVTICGLGLKSFEEAAHGALVIYQSFQNHVNLFQGRLRDWSLPQCGSDIALTFASRYLSTAADAADEINVDMDPSIDPFNVLRPLIKNAKHTADNVVEYWQREEKDGK